MRARNRLSAHVQGELFADLYTVSLTDHPDDAAIGREAPSRYVWAASEVASALRWTETAADARLEQARQLAEDLPEVLAALRDGAIDVPKVLVICELAGWLTDREAARRLVTAVIDDAPELILTTDDCRKTSTELKARGVEFTQEPVEQFYGIDCALRDPFGNHIRVTQPAVEPGQAAQRVAGDSAC